MLNRKRKPAKTFVGKSCRKCKSEIRLCSNGRCYQCTQVYTENTKEHKKQYCRENSSKIKEVSNLYYQNNKDYKKQLAKEYRETHKNERKEWQQRHQKENPKLWTFYANQRRAKKLKATPSW